MEQLNKKVISSQDETLFSAQVSGGYGYDETAKKWRRLTCDSEGKQKIEATLELDSSGLAKESKQDDLINATNRAINNTGAIGDGSVNASSVCLGYDRSNGQGRAILVDSGGKVEVNASMNTGHGLATEAKQDDLINATNRAINNTGAIGDGSTNATSVCLGYDRTNGKGVSILVDSAGVVQVNEDTEYESETLGNASNLTVYGSTTDAIDMLGHSHLVIQATSTATAGASSVQNLKLYYSLDDSNYVLGETITQNNVPGATTQYAGFVRLERTGFRYVKLFAVGVTQSPSAYVVKYSRT